MKKEFIPYELALELRQLGFDKRCIAGYSISREQLVYYSRPLVHNHPSNSSFNVDAPTYSQAFRWFRKKYHLDSWIRPNSIKTYKFIINENIDDNWYNKYEEAELACLKKLIEILKESKNEKEN